MRNLISRNDRFAPENNTSKSRNKSKSIVSDNTEVQRFSDQSPHNNGSLFATQVEYPATSEERHSQEHRKSLVTNEDIVNMVSFYNQANDFVVERNHSNSDLSNKHSINKKNSPLMTVPQISSSVTADFKQHQVDQPLTPSQTDEKSSSSNNVYQA